MAEGPITTSKGPETQKTCWLLSTNFKRAHGPNHITPTDVGWDTRIKEAGCMPRGSICALGSTRIAHRLNLIISALKRRQNPSPDLHFAGPHHSQQLSSSPVVLHQKRHRTHRAFIRTTHDLNSLYLSVITSTESSIFFRDLFRSV